MDNQSLGKIKVMGTHIDRRAEYIHKYVVRGSKFVLEREPDNGFDPNAIKILLSVRKGQHLLELGYVPRLRAAELAPLMDQGVEIKSTFRTLILNEKTGGLVALYLNLTRMN